MSWSDAYFEIAMGTLLGAVGVAIVMLARRRRHRGETSEAPTAAASHQPAPVRVDVRFFFYLSATFFGLAEASAAPFPWSLIGIPVALTALVLATRAMPGKRNPGNSKGTA